MEVGRGKGPALTATGALILGDRLAKPRHRRATDPDTAAIPQPPVLTRVPARTMRASMGEARQGADRLFQDADAGFGYAAIRRRAPRDAAAIEWMTCFDTFSVVTATLGFTESRRSKQRRQRQLRTKS